MYVAGLNWDIKLNILMEDYIFKRKLKELLLVVKPLKSFLMLIPTDYVYIVIQKIFLYDD